MGVAGKEIIHYVKFYEYGRTTEKKGSQMGTNETRYVYILYINYLYMYECTYIYSDTKERGAKL